MCIENVDITRISPRGAKSVSCYGIKSARSICLSHRWCLVSYCSHVLILVVFKSCESLFRQVTKILHTHGNKCVKFLA